MNATYTEEFKHNMADEDAMIVKTFNDSGYQVSVETDGMSVFGTKTGKDLLKTLQNEMQEAIDKEILAKMKEVYEQR